MWILTVPLCSATSIAFLTPCHSTPWLAHIHRNITMRFLDCSPRFVWSTRAKLQAIMHPSARRKATLMKPTAFLQIPLVFLRTATLPISGLRSVAQFRSSANHFRHCSHVVAFDAVLEHISSWLAAHGFEERARFFHAHVHMDYPHSAVHFFERACRDTALV